MQQLLAMKNALLLFALLGFSLTAFSQTKVHGIIKDDVTGELLMGVNVIYAPGQGTVTDINGEYSLSIAPGDYQFEVAYVGYETLKKSVKVAGRDMTLNFDLSTSEMDEIEIVADVALERKTPVAFTDIPAIKIREELGARDFPMLLNSTPGVYATQSGGGDGDARVNIRGFNQRNIAVMVDGIPMNDMENGWVYWSNWFGLDAVTQKTQVQRGLGASKLAVPAVGGNMNILSQGIENKFNANATVEYGNNNNRRITVGLNTGRMENGWGFTTALSYKDNDGWVNNLNSRQIFYFFKLQKEFEKHNFSLSAMGSPQMHEQRLGRSNLAFYDVKYAVEQGYDTTGFMAAGVPMDKGLRFNSEWGFLKRDRYDDNAPVEAQSARTNYYHKPIINFKHFWTPNSRTAISNIVYASFGKGGGTRANTAILDAEGMTNFQYMYDKNTKPIVNFLGVELFPYDLNYVNDTSQYKSSYYLQSSINNHQWYGLLSTVKYKVNEEIEITGGFDGRTYKVDRYQVVYDLLGGDYVTVDRKFQDQNLINENGFSQVVRREGQKINYDISTYVHQAGLFFLGEYSKPRFSAFVNLTASTHDYQRVDHFALKVNDEKVKSDWQHYLGYTGKTGAKFILNKTQNVFANIGYLNRAPNVANTFSGTTLNIYQGLANEKIASAEAGYNLKIDKFRAVANAYYTTWANRPVTGSRTNGTDQVFYNVTGLKAVHKGFELETEYSPVKNLTLEGVLSLGDWRWNSSAEAVITNEIGTEILDTVRFDATGVKVSDAAQTQVSFALRYEPIKNFYFKPRYTYFNNYFAEFNPDALTGDNSRRQSWKVPSYYMVDLSFGYNYDVSKKYRVGFRANLINVTDSKWISNILNQDGNVFVTDALNNEFGGGFDAQSAGVYYGMGFRWNFGITFSYK